MAKKFKKLFEEPKEHLQKIIIRLYKDLLQAPELLYSVIHNAGMCSFFCAEIEDKDNKDKKKSWASLSKHATDLKGALTTIEQAGLEACPFKKEDVKNPWYKEEVKPLLDRLSSSTDTALEYAIRELSDGQRSTKSSDSNPAKLPKKGGFKMPFSS